MDKNWEEVSARGNLTEQFILDNRENIHWHILLSSQRVPIEILETCLNKLDWFSVSSGQFLTEDFIDTYQEYISWNALSFNPNVILSDSFKEKHSDKLIYLPTIEEMRIIENAKILSLNEYLELQKQQMILLGVDLDVFSQLSETIEEEYFEVYLPRVKSLQNSSS